MTDKTQDKEVDVEIAEDLANFFVDLASKQKPLGEEFTKVLNDNLDTLYGS